MATVAVLVPGPLGVNLTCSEHHAPGVIELHGTTDCGLVICRRLAEKSELLGPLTTTLPVPVLIFPVCRTFEKVSVYTGLVVATCCGRNDSELSMLGQVFWPRISGDSGVCVKSKLS